MRGKMRDAGKQSYSASYEIGKPLDARGVAEVIESKNAKYPVGSIIHAFVGWEEYTVLPDLPTTRIIPGARETNLPLSSYVGVLGMPGLTAWASLKDIGKPKKGETIFISAASGAVGTFFFFMRNIHNQSTMGKKLRFALTCFLVLLQ